MEEKARLWIDEPQDAPQVPENRVPVPGLLDDDMRHDLTL